MTRCIGASLEGQLKSAPRFELRKFLDRLSGSIGIPYLKFSLGKDQPEVRDFAAMSDKLVGQG